MSGGLLQLVAYGAQDIYLTGNPSITYFNVQYRRNTSFKEMPSPKHICLDFTPYSAEIVAYECAICLSDFDLTSQVHITKCNHVYHHGCLYSYIECIGPHNLEYKCPLCRTSLDIITQNLDSDTNYAKVA